MYPTKMDKTSCTQSKNCTVCTRCFDSFFTEIVTVCPRSLDPVKIVTYFIKWAKTSWKKKMKCIKNSQKNKTNKKWIC